MNYGTAYNNAFWSSGYAVFGDGDGANFSPLTNLDVVAHELTHGVVEATAGLIYEGESGALNESYADAFAAVVEHSVEGDSDDVWLIGEDCWTPNTDGDALRYMADPTLDGSSRDHYDDRYQGSQDNGGVHLNSGIPNLAFYLTAQGGSHPSGGDPVQGIGIEKAGKIWIQALQASLTASSTLSDARDATLMAAIDLYGDEDESLDVLALAWHLVGLGDPPDSSNDSDLEQAASPCSGEDTVVTGSISGTGASVQVTDSPYYVDLAGTHQGCLAGNRQANLDLVLLQFIGGRWTRVASGNSGSSRESVSYEGSRGYYSWAVRSRQGSGSFVMGFTTP